MPFLFLLAAEGFHLLMASLEVHDLFAGYPVGWGDTTVVSHLQFEDDTLILGVKS